MNLRRSGDHLRRIFCAFGIRDKSQGRGLASLRSLSKRSKLRGGVFDVIGIWPTDIVLVQVKHATFPAQARWKPFATFSARRCARRSFTAGTTGHGYLISARYEAGRSAFGEHEIKRPACRLLLGSAPSFLDALLLRQDFWIAIPTPRHPRLFWQSPPQSHRTPEEVGRL